MLLAKALRADRSVLGGNLTLLKFAPNCRAFILNDLPYELLESVT